jgi:hypothetical protein
MTDGEQAQIPHSDEIKELAVEYIKTFGLGHHFATRVLIEKTMSRDDLEAFAPHKFDPRYAAEHDDLRRYVNNRKNWDSEE